MSAGWICLHRSIMDHWLWKNRDYYQAWTAILMCVNHTSREVGIGARVFIAERGESLRSCEQWAAIFGEGWDRFRVRRFFRMLEDAGMIRTKNERKTLRIEVVKYDTYQIPRTNGAQSVHSSRTKRARSRSQTTMTDTEYKEEAAAEKDAPTDAAQIFAKIQPHILCEKHEVPGWMHLCEAHGSIVSKAVSLCKEERREKGLPRRPCMSDVSQAIEDYLRAKRTA